VKIGKMELLKVWIVAIVLGIIIVIIGIKRARYEIEKKAVLNIFAAYVISLTVILLILPIIIVQIPPIYYKLIEIIALIITIILLFSALRMLYNRYCRHH